MSAPTIRVADPERDATAIAAIYRPIVLETATSFEVDPPSSEEMSNRVRSTLETYPWIVAEQAGEVVAYAYGSRLRARSAYRFSVEVSVYLAERARGRGLGRRIYDALLRVLEDLGYANAYAGIALPNEASVRLHESMGFRSIGVFERVGFKRGAWHDVSWWQLELQPGTLEAPESFSDLSDSRLGSLLGGH
ncbi:MAG: arsinothricin resistance N-acetyltransferase ArsN1 family B [Planctomycetota bacterium]